MKYKIDTIINYITEIEPMTLARLHKILYFAQAASLINLGKEMFKEKIVASSDGPFLPEVQKKYFYFINKIRYDRKMFDELDQLINEIPGSKKVDDFSETISGQIIRILIEKTRDFNDMELSQKTKYSFWKECYNREDKIMKPKEILKFHKAINGFNEIEKPSGKIYEALEISKFIINKFENTNPLSLLRILYFLNRDWKNVYGYNLFSDEIKFVSSGPIIEDVYNKYKFFGSSKIYSNEKSEIKKADHSKIINIIKKYPYNSSTELLELFFQEQKNA